MSRPVGSRNLDFNPDAPICSGCETGHCEAYKSPAGVTAYRSLCGACRKSQPKENKPRHALSNLNIDAQVADCALCGPSVQVLKADSIGHFRCRNAVNACAREYYRAKYAPIRKAQSIEQAAQKAGLSVSDYAQKRQEVRATWHILSNIDKEKRLGNCSICGITDLYLVQGKYKCRKHVDAKGLEWKKNNPERYKEVQRNIDLKRCYQMTSDEYASRLRDQSNVCAVCKQSSPTILAVDHDHACCDKKHSCGKCVRGLLCDTCNLTIGRVEKAMILGLLISISGPIADYLNKWKAVHEAEKAKAASAI